MKLLFSIPVLLKLSGFGLRFFAVRQSENYLLKLCNSMLYSNRPLNEKVTWTRELHT